MRENSVKSCENYSMPTKYYQKTLIVSYRICNKLNIKIKLYFYGEETYTLVLFH